MLLIAYYRSFFFACSFILRAVRVFQLSYSCIYFLSSKCTRLCSHIQETKKDRWSSDEAHHHMSEEKVLFLSTKTKSFDRGRVKKQQCRRFNQFECTYALDIHWPTTGIQCKENKMHWRDVFKCAPNAQKNHRLITWSVSAKREKTTINCSKYRSLRL